MNALLTAAVLSLMLPIRMETGLILVRPFEFLIALGMLGWPLIAARRGVRVPVGLLLLLPYFTWHVASATVGGPRNTAREVLQVFVVTMFAFLLAQEAPRLDVKRFSRRLLLGIAAIALGTIAWHIAHGYWVGWKQLPDLRLSFVFLPVVLAGLILFAKAERRRRLHFVWAGIFPVLLMSGERKALVIYLILSALLFARGRFALILPALASAFVGLLLLSTVVENPYLQKQIRTLVEPGGTGNYEYVLATGRYLPGDTPSDVQRAFALHVSSQMFAEHPLFGVGTNQYEAIVRRDVSERAEGHAARDPRRVPADPDGERIGRFLPLPADLGGRVGEAFAGPAGRARSRPADEGAGEGSAAPALHSPGALCRDRGLRNTGIHRCDHHLPPAGAGERGVCAGAHANASPIGLARLVPSRHFNSREEPLERVGRHEVPRRGAHDRGGRT